MKIIGLTGGIASGKSMVSAHLRRLGAVVVDADEISRAMTAPGGPALPAIYEAFGGGVFKDHALDRRALADVIFQDAGKRAALNAIVHPLVLEQMRDQTEKARCQGERFVFWDVPLLFETGFDRFVDETWLVAADEPVQLERLMARDALGREQALARIRSQMPLAQKRLRADVVLENNGTLLELTGQAEAQWRRLNGT